MDIVIKFDTGTKVISMGVFAAGASPSSDSDLTLTGTSAATAGIDNFALRQGSASGTAMGINIDSIIVGTTLPDVVAVPEPSSMPLAAVRGLACLVAVRRRR